MSKTPSNTNTASCARRLGIFAAAILLPLLLTSCGKQGQESEKKTVQKSEDDFLEKDAKPMNRNISWRRNPSLSPSPIENTRTLTRYSPKSRQGANVPRSVYSLLSRTLILSKTNRMHSTT